VSLRPYKKGGPEEYVNYTPSFLICKDRQGGSREVSMVEKGGGGKN